MIQFKVSLTDRYGTVSYSGREDWKELCVHGIWIAFAIVMPPPHQPNTARTALTRSHGSRVVCEISRVIEAGCSEDYGQVAASPSWMLLCFASCLHFYPNTRYTTFESVNTLCYNHTPGRIRDQVPKQKQSNTLILESALLITPETREASYDNGCSSD